MRFPKAVFCFINKIVCAIRMSSQKPNSLPYSYQEDMISSNMFVDSTSSGRRTGGGDTRHPKISFPLRHEKTHLIMVIYVKHSKFTYGS